MENFTIPATATTAKSNSIEASLPISRIASVDVYSGFVMLLMVGEVLSFKSVPQALPGNGFWSFMNFH